ncbi:MAG: signal peptide peptidase SppA [Bacteroidota bacterium]
MAENTPQIKKVTFGRIFWPSLLAAFIISILGTIIFFLGLGGFVASFGETETKEIKNNSVLHLTLNGEIGESSSSKINVSSLGVETKIGLTDLLYGFEQAKSDDKIKGIFIELKAAHCGMSTAKEIRKAINDFEKSGKFVVAYNTGEVITQKEYYISSAANKSYGFPSSMMEFVGLGGEMTFFKNTLDLLEVEMQVIRGKNNDFKSAVEPFFLTKMSDSSRLQTTRYMNNIWQEMLSDISKERKVTVSDLNSLAENFKIKRISDAVKYKLIDAVKYRDEVLEILVKKSGQSSTDELNLTSFEKYAKKKFETNQLIVQNNANIAVLVAEGDVSIDGDGLSSTKICKALREIRENKKIKTVVFRINSPGGSALASDEIWREVYLLNKKKKVIVSMGDVAASGGYYIAAPAYKIFAEPTTITGSIGVFGVIPYTGKMFENKLGLSFDQVATNKHSVVSTNRKLTTEEIGVIQEEVDVIYDEFLSRVAAGRNMTKTQVNQIARGRVWTGSDALKIGLVDEIGGLKDAISYAAKISGAKVVNIVYYPKKKESPYDAIFELLEADEESVKVQQKLPQSILKNYEMLLKLESMKGIQMRLPYYFEFD